MNTYNLNLVSTNTATIETLPLIDLDDYTLLTINLEQLSETVIPIYLTISWEPNSVETYDNNLYRSGNNYTNPLRFSPLLTTEYSHEYFPSERALYKSLSAQVLVKYSNGDETWFVIPIRIRANGYFESIQDLTFINTNILPISSNKSEHHLKTTKDGYIIELRGE